MNSRLLNNLLDLRVACNGDDDVFTSFIIRIIISVLSKQCREVMDT